MSEVVVKILRPWQGYFYGDIIRLDTKTAAEIVKQGAGEHVKPEAKKESK